MRSRATACILGATLIAASLWGCVHDTHDPSRWAGAPWSLRDAALPADRASIVTWLRGVGDHPVVPVVPFYDVGDTRKVHLNVSVSDMGRSSETISELWFARPHGSWVFQVSAASPDEIQLCAQALTDALR